MKDHIKGPARVLLWCLLAICGAADFLALWNQHDGLIWFSDVVCETRSFSFASSFGLLRAVEIFAAEQCLHHAQEPAISGILFAGKITLAASFGVIAWLLSLLSPHFAKSRDQMIQDMSRPSGLPRLIGQLTVGMGILAILAFGGMLVLWSNFRPLPFHKIFEDFDAAMVFVTVAFIPVSVTLISSALVKHAFGKQVGVGLGDRF